MKKTSYKVLLLFFVVIGVILFTLGNGCLNYEASHTLSGIFAKWLGNSAGDLQKNDMIVRKIAHIGEYAFLGAVAMVLFRRAKKNNKSSSVWCVLFSLLAIGVLDEFFQGFSSRNSSVNDILLDFAGGVLGMCLTTALIKVINFVKHKRLCKGGRHNE